MEIDYKTLIENMTDGLYLVDKNRFITHWNKAAESITGYTAEEVVGKRCMDNILVHVDEEGRSLCRGLCPLARAIKDGKSRQTHAYLHHKLGHRVPVLIRTLPIRDKSDAIVGGAELFSDAGSRRVLVDRIRDLEKLAIIDDLTGLSNRRYMEKELEGSLQEYLRYGMNIGILFMDIDHFKKFNDTYGHIAGDMVLKAVARTILSSQRPFDHFGRWGGEEIVGIVRNVDAKALKTLGNRYRYLIEKSIIHYEGKSLHVAVSVGATLMRETDTMSVVIKRADQLMYTSKQNGRNQLTLG
ncbi:MAG: sensor domain-containing diguanylate cyclase [Desulfobacteraceae bacterium]|nr:sensor domain-containing diguanylate cyclase [Desulfobacteraceae bacterium]